MCAGITLPKIAKYLPHQNVIADFQWHFNEAKWRPMVFCGRPGEMHELARRPRNAGPGDLIYALVMMLAAYMLYSCCIGCCACRNMASRVMSYVTFYSYVVGDLTVLRCRRVGEASIALLALAGGVFWRY